MLRLIKRSKAVLLLYYGVLKYNQGNNISDLCNDVTVISQPNIFMRMNNFSTVLCNHIIDDTYEVFTPQINLNL